MSDNWNTYFTSIDDKPASVLLDMNPWDDGDLDKFVRLYRLSVSLKEPNENGLTTNQEADALYAIEDSINDALSGHYRFVGRITTAGKRDFYYYTELPDESELASLVVKPLERYSYTIVRVEETNLGDFHREVLYPNAKERQRIANRLLADRLRELGDDLESPRTVNHWIYFDSTEQRNRFKHIVHKVGFRIEEEPDEEQPYKLRISRTDDVHFHAISEVTDYLVDAAEQCHGDYDGWESIVLQERKGFLSGVKKLFKKNG